MIEIEEISTSKDKKRWYIKPSIITHILIGIFGTSGWIGVNGIFLQTPLFINSLPEKWTLTAYLVIIVQTANFVPFIYSLLYKYVSKLNESNYILVLLGINSVAMLLLMFLYDKISVIAGIEYSVSLFVLTFCIAIVGCTSNVLFMPYVRNFKEIYLISYFIGEGLSGFIPSVAALVQGIGESSTCNTNITNITEVPFVTLPRFSSKYYFLFIFGCLILSLISFILLENLSFINKEKIRFCTSDNNFSKNEIESFPCERQKSVLSEDSITENNKMKNRASLRNDTKTDVEAIPNINHTQPNKRFTLKDLYFYILLNVICFIIFGLFPGFQPYSCMPYGDMTFHLSVIFSQMAHPTAYLLALWISTQNIKVINCLSIIIFIMSSYIIYFSIDFINSPLQDLIIGKVLIILIWTLVAGFIAYVRLIITSIFRREKENLLYLAGLAVQIGSTSGAILSFILINYMKLLPEYKSCDYHNN